MELSERVRALAEHFDVSLTKLGERLGCKQNTFNYYLTKKTQDNLWKHLPKILEFYPQLNRDWLFFGEGPMLRADVQPAPAAPPSPSLALAAKPIPVLGLTPCGVEGWFQTAPIPIATTLPVTPSMFAVIATGESMVPAGIAPGHICYCDPDQSVLVDEAVYVAAIDGRATIKEFVGEAPNKPGMLRFRGWRTQHDGRRKEFFLDLADKDVEKIAPVIFVRRRI